MEERATGIILRTHPLTETSLIVRWLTYETGRIDTVARGARRPRSPWRGKLDLFYRAQISYVRSRRSELHALREVDLLETHKGIRTDLDTLRQASYATAWIARTTESGAPVPDLFELLEGLLRRLAALGSDCLLMFAFELGLLNGLGLFPPANLPGLSPDARRFVQHHARSPWAAFDDPALRPNASVALEIDRFLHTWLAQHVGRVPPDRTRVLRLQ
jgi:DNA repair protein RecO (recombination protein O)